MKKIAVATLLVAIIALIFTGLTFFASITSWFKHSIPIEFGFLVNGRIIQSIELSTGDPAKWSNPRLLFDQPL